MYLTMEEYQRAPRTMLHNGEEANTEYLLDLFQGADGWYIVKDDMSETGPFDTLDLARTEADRMLHEEGFQVLSEFPWGAPEANAYPINGAGLSTG